MSAYPLVIEGSALEALVVGGGNVATRKALSLLAAGARVRVVAPDMSAALEDAAASQAALQLTRARYSAEHLGSAMLVVAATDDPDTNASIAADAKARGRLVNVVSAPEIGNCATPAVHRAGDVVVAVTTGGVPGAAARIRDALGRTIDSRYAAAVRELATLRRTMLDAGERERWSRASAALVGAEFCESVESGDFDTKVAEWR